MEKAIERFERGQRGVGVIAGPWPGPAPLPHRHHSNRTMAHQCHYRQVARRDQVDGFATKTRRHEAASGIRLLFVSSWRRSNCLRRAFTRALAEGPGDVALRLFRGRRRGFSRVGTLEECEVAGQSFEQHPAPVGHVNSLGDSNHLILPHDISYAIVIGRLPPPRSQFLRRRRGGHWLDTHDGVWLRRLLNESKCCLNRFSSAL